MKLKHIPATIDINSRSEQRIAGIVNINDKKTRYLDVTIIASGEKLDISGCTVTAIFVIDDVLVNNAVDCTVTNNIVTIPLENFNGRYGYLSIELNIVKDGTVIVNTPVPLKIQVTSSIADSAKISEKTYGTIAETVKEVHEARGNFESIGNRFNETDAAIEKTKDEVLTKADKADVTNQLSKLKDDINDSFENVRNVRDNINKIEEYDLEYSNILKNTIWYHYRVVKPFNMLFDEFEGFAQKSNLFIVNSNSYSRLPKLINGKKYRITGIPKTLKYIISFINILTGDLKKEVTSKNNDYADIEYTCQEDNISILILLYNNTEVDTSNGSNVNLFKINGLKSKIEKIEKDFEVEIENAKYEIESSATEISENIVESAVNLNSFFKNWYHKRIVEKIPSYEEIDNPYFLSTGRTIADANDFPKGTELNLSINSGYKYFIYLFDINGVIKQSFTEKTYTAKSIVSEENQKILICMYRNDAKEISINERKNVTAIVYDNDIKRKNIELENRIKKLEDSQVEVSSIFFGKTMNILGDSLTEVNQHYTKGYYIWMKEILGLSMVNNYGISGSSISTKSKPMCERYATMGDADIVLVMGGTNDCTWGAELGTKDSTDNGTVYGAMKTLCDGLKTKYPTSIIVFITPHFQTKYQHPQGYNAMDISKIIKDVCYDYAIPVYDNNQLCGIYSSNLNNFTVDNCHWNDTAHEMVGKNLSKWMLDTFRFIYGA